MMTRDLRNLTPRTSPDIGLQSKLPRNPNGEIAVSHALDLSRYPYFRASYVGPNGDFI